MIKNQIVGTITDLYGIFVGVIPSSTGEPVSSPKSIVSSSEKRDRFVRSIGPFARSCPSTLEARDMRNQKLSTILLQLNDKCTPLFVVKYLWYSDTFSH